MNYNATVSNTSIKIVPLPRLRNAPAWVTSTAYSIGNYVKSKGRYYMATSTGTSGATDPEGVGSVSDGTVTWVSCLQHPRKGITIVNEGSIALYVSMTGPASASTGIALSASGGALTLSGDSVEECEFHAIRSAATPGNVAILEW